MSGLLPSAAMQSLTSGQISRSDGIIGAPRIIRSLKLGEVADEDMPVGISVRGDGYLADASSARPTSGCRSGHGQCEGTRIRGPDCLPFDIRPGEVGAIFRL